jgi:hypothetical protein
LELIRQVAWCELCAQWGTQAFVATKHRQACELLGDTCGSNRKTSTVVHNPSPSNCTGQCCTIHIEPHPNPLAATPRQHRHDFFELPEDANQLPDQMLAHCQPPQTSDSTIDATDNHHHHYELDLMNRKGNCTVQNMDEIEKGIAGHLSRRSHRCRRHGRQVVFGTQVPWFSQHARPHCGCPWRWLCKPVICAFRKKSAR